MDGSASFAQLFQCLEPLPRDDSDSDQGTVPVPSRHGSQGQRNRRSPAGDPNPSDSSSSDDDENGDRNRRGPGRPMPRPQRKLEQPAKSASTHEAHFDFKLKMDVVPTWDGDTSTLARWILRINSVAKKSTTVRRQLGMVVPQRLTGDAEVWYFSLPEDVHEDCELDWENIRAEIGEYYMNRTWREKTRKQAMGLRYRELGHTRELPSQYFIRKRELLELVYDNSESELISDIMTGAPLSWRTILTPRLYATTSDLQRAIKLHEGRHTQR